MEFEKKENRCERCRHWQRIDDVRGECHRYPKPHDKAFLDQWTQTNAVDWCGEFAEIREEQTTTEKRNGKASGSKKR